MPSLRTQSMRRKARPFRPAPGYLYDDAREADAGRGALPRRLEPRCIRRCRLRLMSGVKPPTIPVRESDLTHSTRRRREP
jgi:hypothetical protein